MKASRGRRKNKVASKKELVEVAALSKLGHTPYAISQRTGFHHDTVAKYLREQEEFFNQPEVKEAISRYIAVETGDLVALTVKARKRLHEIAHTMNPIEALALMDRSFQQRRLLEGKSTSNISTLSKIIREANKDLED